MSKVLKLGITDNNNKKISDKMEHFFLDNTITCLFNKASICAFHSPNQVAVDDFLPLMVSVGGFKLVPLAATVYLLPELFQKYPKVWVRA